MPIHIIDDKRFITDIVSDLVSYLSKQRLCFHSAEEYLAYMHSENYNEPKLIITDIMMGEMNGFTLINEIRKINSSVKIMIMSGYHHHQAIESNYDAAISKPFDAQALTSMVAQIYSDKT